MSDMGFPIDMVYLWVDGNDPQWQIKRDSLLKDSKREESKNGRGRFANNDELKYSLRSLFFYAPWIRNIYIVTDKQVPTWLNLKNEKVKIIDHSDILPPEALPTFNSRIIEHHIHLIPGLANNFLYANDDMFFNHSVGPEDFFLSDGRPIVRWNRRPFRKLSLWLKEHILKKKTSNYNHCIQNSAKLVEKKYGRYIGHKTHHNIDAYCKSDYTKTYETFKNEITPTLYNHFRSDNDIQRNIYSHVPVILKRAKVRFVNQKESFRCHIDNERNFRKLEKIHPLLFCLNDSEYADENDRVRVKKFLERRFPDKSPFEK